MAYAGIIPVATKNNGDPTNGRIPLRNTGDVLSEMTMPQFADSKVRNFHRYASVDLVGVSTPTIRLLQRLRSQKGN